MNEYQIDYRMGNLADDNAIKNWLGNQKNNVRSIDDYTFDETNQLMGLKKDGYMFYFNIDGTEVEVYIINYVLNGGTNEENAVESYSKGDTIQLPVPTKEGAQFLGWSITNNDSENTISNITSDMEGDLTLYACWINELPENYFTYSTDGTGITGFDVDGTAAYNSAQEMDLVFPSKHKVNNNDVTITSISGFNGRTKIKKLVIPDTVTTISNSTFSSCTGIEYIKIPISTAITGNITFYNVSNVKEVYFSKGTGIGATYNGDSIKNTAWNISKANLTKVTLEKGITSIGSHMFINCNNIDMKWEDIINNNNDLEIIEANAFCGCTKIKGDLVFPPKITKVNYESFANCIGIEKLVIPNTITILENRAFGGCSGIKYLNIPISLAITKNVTFEGVKNVEEVFFSKGTGIGATYNGDSIKNTPWNISKANLTKVTLEKGITSIGSHMFIDCNNIDMKWEDIINNNNDLEIIEANAFCGCTKIKGDLVFPPKITKVNYESFANCVGIEKLVIPNTITILENRAFGGCSGIKYLNIPISLAITKNVTFEGVKNVEEVFFSKGTGIGATYDGNSVKYTPWNISKANLTKVTLEKGITSIGSYTFSDCNNIVANWEDIINNREELTSIGEYAFCNCTKIKGELEFPSKITSIYRGTFIYCTGIERLIIPDTITTLQNNTFRQCTGIKYIKIPISLYAGGNLMFTGAENIEEVCLSKGTGVGATYGRDEYKFTPWYISRAKFTKLTLEKGITSIGNYTLKDCNNISTIKFTGTQTEWNAIAKGSNNNILSTVTVECEQQE